MSTDKDIINMILRESHNTIKSKFRIHVSQMITVVSFLGKEDSRLIMWPFGPSFKVKEMTFFPFPFMTRMRKIEYVIIDVN